MMMSVAAAQADPEDEIARCARISSVGDRILCLEDALRQAAGREATATAMPASKAAATSPDDTRAKGAASDEVVGKTVAEHADVGGEPSGITRGSSVTEAGQFGLDESQRNPDPLESIEVTVVSVDANVYDKLIYLTEDGQNWLQSDQRTPRYSQIPFKAEIRKAAAGSYFIQPLVGGIAVRVKRTK
jgi:hypothetical protein